MAANAEVDDDEDFLATCTALVEHGYATGSGPLFEVAAAPTPGGDDFDAASEPEPIAPWKLLTRDPGWFVDGTFHQTFAALPLAVRARLCDLGLGPDRLARWQNAFSDRDDIESFAARQRTADLEDFSLRRLADMIELVASRSSALSANAQGRRAAAAIVGCGPALAAAHRDLADSGAKRIRLEQEVRTAAEAAVGQPAGASDIGPIAWKTRRGKKIAALSGDPEDQAHQRAKIEETERQRWSRRWAELLWHLALPVTLLLSAVADPISALCRVTGRRRGSTLRMRFKDCIKMTSWCQKAFLHNWFQGPSEFLQYLESLVADCCGRTVPRTRLAALATLEKFGEVAQRISASTLVVEAVNQIEVQLSVGADAIKKSPQYVLMVIVSLELFAASSRERYKRWIACGELIKIYATLRGDDLYGIVHKTWRRGKRGIQALLRRTKTSGAGRRVLWLPLFISHSCSLSGVDWISAFWSMLKSESYGFERDYFYPMPGADMDDTVRTSADPETISGMRAALLREIRLPIYNAVQRCWEETADVYLLVAALVLFWKSHSARKVLPTAAAIFGYAEEDRDKLGSWSADGSDNYVLSKRAVVFSIQDRIMDVLRNRPQVYDEGEVTARIEDQLREAGVSEEMAGWQLAVLSLGSYIEQIGNAAAIRAADEGLEQEADLETLRRMGVLAAVLDQSPEEHRWHHMVASEAELAVTCIDSIAAGSKARLPRTADARDEVSVGPGDEDAGAFILSATASRNYITLHRRGGCFRVPGIHLRNVSYMREVNENDYTARCKDCFGLSKRKVASNTAPTDLGGLTPSAMDQVEAASVGTESESESGSESDASDGGPALQEASADAMDVAVPSSRAVPALLGQSEDTAGY